MFGLLLAACLVGASVSGAKADRQSLTIFAAASLREVLDEIATDFERQSGTGVRVSYGGSGTLAKQIEQGAPADLFLSAHPNWVDYLKMKGALAAEPLDRKSLAPEEQEEASLEKSAPLANVNRGANATPLAKGSQGANFTPRSPLAPLASNELVLIVSRASAMERFGGARLPSDFAELLGADRFAVPHVASVPAGIYAKQALTALGLWQDLKSKAAFTQNVRASLALVATGALPAGIVYRSDARSDPRVQIVYRFAAELHEPIAYHAALVSGSDNETAAEAFLAFLTAPAAGAVFERAGFVWPAHFSSQSDPQAQSRGGDG